MNYDACLAPYKTEWLSLDESERIRLVQDYHRRTGIVIPNDRLHACMHVMVENQLAMNGIIEVGETLIRLQEEGLDRHESIHAIASIVSKNIYRAVKLNEDCSDDEYREQLRGLSGKTWEKAL